jgi:hypothetical protein
MAAWLRRGAVAAKLAAERSDLWVPGALVSFAGAGWIVLPATVAPPPSASGLAGFGLQLAASAWWPWNVAVLGVAILSGIGTLLLAVAFGEVAMLMGLTAARLDSRPSSVPRAAGVLAMAALPVAALVLLLAWLAVRGVLEGSPTGPLWLWLVPVAVAIVVAQPFGAAVLRLPRRAGIAAVSRRGHFLIPQAAITMTAFVVGQVVTAGILAMLWRPLANRLADVGPTEPSTAILLLGFVWIWLVLVILAGAGQAWTTAWWSAELDGEAGD